MKELIDFCVALSSPNVDTLWPTFWSTLTKHCDINRDSVKLHLINKDLSNSTLGEITKIIGSAVNYTVHQLPIVRYDGYGKPIEAIKYDVAYTCNYMVTECGTCDWLCISHFDIVFKANWLEKARSLIGPKVAMIGHHCPIMLLRRSSYIDSKTKFDRPIGYDTGQMLEKELVEAGWKVESFEDFNEESKQGLDHKWFHHIGGGGTHYKQSDISEKKRVVDSFKPPIIETRDMAQTLIHLQVINSFACGSMRLAIGTTLQQFNQQMTGEPRAVNCEMCKKTEAFKIAMEKIGK